MKATPAIRAFLAVALLLALPGAASAAVVSAEFLTDPADKVS